MNAPEDRSGSKPVKPGLSKCFPVAPESGYGAALLFRIHSPAFRERCHRGLSRRLVAMRRRAAFVIVKNQRPHPRQAHGRGGGLHDAADERRRRQARRSRHRSIRRMGRLAEAPSTSHEAEPNCIETTEKKQREDCPLDHRDHAAIRRGAGGWFVHGIEDHEGLVIRETRETRL
jgi:hypothetical protein